MKVMKLVFGLIVAGAFISNAQALVKIQNVNIGNGIICKAQLKAGAELLSPSIPVGGWAEWAILDPSEVDSISVTHQGTGRVVTKVVGTVGAWKAVFNPTKNAVVVSPFS